MKVNRKPVAAVLLTARQSPEETSTFVNGSLNIIQSIRKTHRQGFMIASQIQYLIPVEKTGSCKRTIA